MELEKAWLTILVAGIATFLFLYHLLTKKKSKYPPGPYIFPFIGNLPQLLLAGSISKFAQYYRKKYGDVFTFEFGGNKRVVLSGYDTIHSLIVKNADQTSNRSVNSLPRRMKDVTKVSPGLFWAPFPHWKTLRTFTIATLREEGMGKTAMEPKILDELENYISHFVKPNLGKPFKMAHNISQATCNVTSQLLFGKRFDYDDEVFNKMISAIDETIGLTVNVAMMESMPLGNLFIKSAVARETFLSNTYIIPIMQQYIDEHMESIDKEHPRGVADRYLIHSKNENKGQTGNSFSADNAWCYNYHIYIAGTETTATALKWALLYMCLNPEIKERVQKEIDEKIGRDRAVAYKDRFNMPYTEAVMLETLRIANVVPTALPHTADQDLVVNGVTIPAGLDLTLNMASVLCDETVFEEPEKFKPERYLTGDIALKKQMTIPFGIGRRTCPGESLARMEFFIFFVTFLQRFNVDFPQGEVVKVEPIEALVRFPKPYNIVFSARS